MPASITPELPGASGWYRRAVLEEFDALLVHAVRDCPGDLWRRPGGLRWIARPTGGCRVHVVEAVAADFTPTDGPWHPVTKTVLGEKGEQTVVLQDVRGLEDRIEDRPLMALRFLAEGGGSVEIEILTHYRTNTDLEQPDAPPQTPDERIIYPSGATIEYPNMQFIEYRGLAS